MNVKKILGVIVVLTVLLSGLAELASAQTTNTLYAVPFRMPDATTCTLQAEWMSRGTEISPSDNRVLSLTNNCVGGSATTTSSTNLLTNTVGVDIVSPLEGGQIRSLTHLGFDVMSDTACGGDSLKFVIVVRGRNYSLTCNDARSVTPSTSSAVTGTTSQTLSTTTGTQATTTATSTGITGTQATSSWRHIAFTQADMRRVGIPTTGTLEDILLVLSPMRSVTGTTSTTTMNTVYVDNVTVNNSLAGDTPMPTYRTECMRSGYYLFGFTSESLCLLRAPAVNAPGTSSQATTTPGIIQNLPIATSTATSTRPLQSTSTPTTSTTSTSTQPRSTSTTTSTTSPSSFQNSTNQTTSGGVNRTNVHSTTGNVYNALNPNPNGSTSGSGGGNY